MFSVNLDFHVDVKFRPTSRDAPEGFQEEGAHRREWRRRRRERVVIQSNEKTEERSKSGRVIHRERGGRERKIAAVEEEVVQEERGKEGVGSVKELPCPLRRALVPSMHSPLPLPPTSTPSSLFYIYVFLILSASLSPLSSSTYFHDFSLSHPFLPPLQVLWGQVWRQHPYCRGLELPSVQVAPPSPPSKVNDLWLLTVAASFSWALNGEEAER